MASVRKRKWNYKGVDKEAWILNYVDLDGKRRQETFDQKKDADRRRKQVENEIENGDHTARRATITLGDAIDGWLGQCKTRNINGKRMTNTTLTNYVRLADVPKAAMGNVLLVDLTSERIQTFVDEKLKTNARRTVSAWLHSIKRGLKWACAKKLLRRNPLDDESVDFGLEFSDEKRIPSKAEIKALLAGLEKKESNQRFRLHEHRAVMVYIALFCGLRRGEILGLQWEHVDFNRSLFMVRKSQSSLDGLKATKTRAGIRTVPVPASVLSLVRGVHEAEGKPKTGYVLTTSAGTPYEGTNVSGAMWKRLMKQSGLVDEKGKHLFSFHALRHANVSLLHDEGLDPLHISKHIGHTDPTITLKVYSHVFPEDQRSADATHSLSEKYVDVAFQPKRRETVAEYNARYRATRKQQENNTVL